jgi:hypothetical protein
MAAGKPSPYAWAIQCFAKLLERFHCICVAYIKMVLVGINGTKISTTYITHICISLVNTLNILRFLDKLAYCVY